MMTFARSSPHPMIPINMMQANPHFIWEEHIPPLGKMPILVSSAQPGQQRVSNQTIRRRLHDEYVIWLWRPVVKQKLNQADKVARMCWSCMLQAEFISVAVLNYDCKAVTQMRLSSCLEVALGQPLYGLSFTSFVWLQWLKSRWTMFE